MLTRITRAAGLATVALTVLCLISPAIAAADPGEPGDPAQIPDPVNPPDPTSYETSLLGGIQSAKVADVMLHLYQGRTATGDPLASDDDSGWGGKNSLLTCTLTGGVDYTVEGRRTAPERLAATPCTSTFRAR